ncbi:MAG: cellobiose phosphorylase [Clostridiales bacterium]|nr:cellobiose phosphorylase [Clostridiales bacterium]
MNIEFTGKNGTFKTNEADKTNYLYLPIGSTSGVMGSVTPRGGGDTKLSQDRFFLHPVVVEDLQESMYSRNFWLYIDGVGLKSALGFSLSQLASEDDAELEAGFLWQKTTRRICDGLKASVLIFSPETKDRAEIMQVTITNDGDKDISFIPSAAIPVFARGADHIRDHRHVTSLLNVIEVLEDGIEVRPTMAFDERGHHRTSDTYVVRARDGEGDLPEGIDPTVLDFAGDGGNLLNPAGAKISQGMVPGSVVTGQEAFAGIKFLKKTLSAGQSAVYNVVLGFDGEGSQFLDSANVSKAFEDVKAHWESEKIIHTKTGDPLFDGWMEWVSVQPALRKLYGCSFLPYHDYGRGGRGWRDLWQDSLALLLRNPADARDDLISYFAGVRMDGSNATIIGSKKGEFIADRNGIPRVWMDHGFWPVFTVDFYIRTTGDYDFLFAEQPYFKDRMILRGERFDDEFDPNSDPKETTVSGEIYKGTVLEHMLTEVVTQFFDCGEHGNMRLRGADWNDALDMASVKGESVAFTAAYAGALTMLSSIIRNCGRSDIAVFEELIKLICADEYDDPEAKKRLLVDYEESVAKNISGYMMIMDAEKLASHLDQMADWIRKHIRENEMVGDGKGNKWFNGYYDNDSKQVEGVINGGVRMMLTSQVFTVMFGTADEETVKDVIKACDEYLYAPDLGGYRLNTDFHEVKMNMGRAFGFAYGEKENGAVFCHMAVMYAFALYTRGFAKEGFKVFNNLFTQSMSEDGRMYPGIPEYFNGMGRGMYPYLTGAASWAVLLVLTKMFGVSSEKGKIKLKPALLASQFDGEGRASVTAYRNGRPFTLTYVNPGKLEEGSYRILSISADGKRFVPEEGCIIPEEAFEGDCPEIICELG